jgi:DNA-cytosine methyltransferase
VRQWARRDVPPDDHLYGCLPTEEELLFLERKFPSSSSSSLTFSSAPTPLPSSSLREATGKRHVDAKSLIVPLTDDATAFILRALFETPMSCASDADRCQKRIAIENWITSNAVTIVHNCDGNQVVSLSKEVDSFPKPSLTIDGNLKAKRKCFTFVDLFAGIGGFRIGMEILGGICIGSCEIDPYARDNYRRNFNQDESRCNAGSEFFVNDITRLEIYPDTVDVICGGFPCQSFSTLASFAPNNKSDEGSAQRVLEGTNPIQQTRQGGLDTPKKGALFFQLLRILRTSLPKLFVFENVKGLMKVDNGRHLKRILHLLEESGYSVSHTLVDTSWFLPQRRERIYFVGIRLDLLRNESSESLIRFKQLEVDLRKKYQIYGNDIMRVAITDKCDRDDNANQSRSPLNASYSLPPSCLGDVLETHESVCRNHSHCFLTTSQWEKLCKQGYIQFHADGSGQLLTDADPCCQTLVSSYRQSFLLHSQFVVPRDSIYLVRQKEQKKIATARKNKGGRDIEQETASVVSESKDPTLPRFFTPREW